MKYKVENGTDESVTVIGLGVFIPGQVREFSSDAAAWFQTVQGVPLAQTNVPNGVKVTVLTGEEA